MPETALDKAFLGLPPPARARVAIQPIGYEGTVTYGRGTAQGPAALLAASTQVELYDEVLELEPARAGIITQPIPDLGHDPRAAVERTRELVAGILERGLYPVVLGGEHTISTGVFLALARAYPDLGVIQIDAHADLRDSYEGTPWSHACVMARIREHTDRVLQIGVRSWSRDEAASARARGYAVGLMHHWRAGVFDLDAALQSLPGRIFLTLDVDCLDPSLLRATGTPEPGGFTWQEIRALLARIFAAKRVVGFDLTELCGDDRVSAFTAARLLNYMLGLALREGHIPGA